MYLSYIADTPWGSIPTLKVGNDVIGQSIALARYAGGRANMAGCNDIEAAKMDAIVDAVDEIRRKPWGLFFADTDEKRVCKN